MDKITPRGKLFIGIGIIAVVAVVAFLMGARQSAAPTGMYAGNDMSNATTTSASSTAAPAPAAGTAGTKTTRPAPFVIHLLSPAANSQWKIAQSNLIAWDHEAGITGEIDLLNPKTKAVVGVILSEIAPHQTSYTWDARQYYLARYNPLKKDVIIGTYLIRLKFDGNNLASITSGPITITQ